MLLSLPMSELPFTESFTPTDVEFSLAEVPLLSAEDVT